LIQLIQLIQSIDTIDTINWYNWYYQLILSMLSDKMYQFFLFLKTCTHWFCAKWSQFSVTKFINLFRTVCVLQGKITDQEIINGGAENVVINNVMYSSVTVLLRTKLQRSRIFKCFGKVYDLTFFLWPYIEPSQLF
jgi:hypothetical protein